MDSYKRFAAICCLMVLLTFKDADSAMTGFNEPVLGDPVTTGVTTGLQSVATVVIVDGTAPGTTITTVTGTADNSGTPELTLTDDAFEIDSGAVKTNSAYTVDYATKSSFSLTITAVDDVDNTVTATLVLTVTVNDLPTFTSPTLCWEIASDAAVGTAVGTYTASAGTVGSTIAYTIAAGDNGDFVTPLANGMLVTLTALGDVTYTLEIKAEDDGAAVAAKSIYVFVRRMAAGATTQDCCSGSGVGGLIGSLIVIIAALTATFM